MHHNALNYYEENRHSQSGWDCGTPCWRHWYPWPLKWPPSHSKEAGYPGPLGCHSKYGIIFWLRRPFQQLIRLILSSQLGHLPGNRHRRGLSEVWGDCKERKGQTLKRWLSLREVGVNPAIATTSLASLRRRWPAVKGRSKKNLKMGSIYRRKSFANK